MFFHILAYFLQSFSEILLEWVHASVGDEAVSVPADNEVAIQCIHVCAVHCTISTLLYFTSTLSISTAFQGT